MRYTRSEHAYGRIPSLEREAHGRFSPQDRGYRRDEDYGDVDYEDDEDYETTGNYNPDEVDEYEDEDEDRRYADFEDNRHRRYRQGHNEERRPAGQRRGFSSLPRAGMRRTGTVNNNMPHGRRNTRGNHRNY